MVITVYSLKGGVGKTSISLNLSVELEHKLIDNDPFGGVTELLNKGKKTKVAYSVHEDEESIPKSRNTVYDFGGFKDNRTHSILAKSDVVIIPTLHSYADIKTTVSTIKRLQDLNQKNIIVAINKVNTATKRKQGSRVWFKDFTDTEEQIKALCSHFDIDTSKIKFIGLRDNKSWLKSTSKGKSLIELAQTSRLVEHSSKSAIEDLNSLLEQVKSYEV